ncbi:hypothetical protein LIER_17626 [Lithospermum erythrorhizon]|uniref:Uncharacterized protein n=1 Tax=Lithospermum erythrorhizon TaxID=34254 RepID=A0AAV3QFE4_LITER
MSTELPVSIIIQPTSKFAITGVIINGSSWGHSIPSKSLLEKDKSGNSGRALVVITYMSLYPYAHHAVPASPPPLLPPQITLTLPVMLGGPSGYLDWSLSKRRFMLWVSLST